MKRKGEDLELVYNKEEIQRKIRVAKEKLLARTQPQKQEVITEEARGLKVQFHPSLLQMNQQRPTNKYKPLLPINTTTTANVKKQQEIKVNPYIDEKPDLKISFDNIRRPKEFKFNEPGKYIKKGNEFRTQEKVQNLKKQIEETARKAGIERELELVSTRAIRNSTPPLVEPWDLKITQDYSNYSYEFINNLIHHPYKLEPYEKPIEPIKLMLTKKEQKKLKRATNLEKQRDKQDRIKLGLLPPEEPRLTKTNFMRVLGHEAILAPSMVDSLMTKQTLTRQKKHLDLTNSTKKTSQEKKESKDLQLRKVVELNSMVFKIKYLNKKSLFKINKNAEQYKLTGCMVLGVCNLLVVEGDRKNIKAYKNLVMNRIGWDFVPDLEFLAADFVQNVDRNDNECVLVWEGVVLERKFRNFRQKRFDVGLDAKDYLEEMGAVEYWNAAKMHLQNDY
jgi:U4/U6 small nuclear ribonucleoprotein PRP3